MALLDVFQRAAPKLGLNTPNAVYGSTRAEHEELGLLANEVADEIADAHNWQALKTLATYTGDGTTTSFVMADDFDYMADDAEVLSSALAAPLYHVPSEADWLRTEILPYSFVVNIWTMIGDRMLIKPAMGTGTTAQHYYQTTKWALDASGVAQTSFTADTDRFRLDERLLELGIVWQWKSNHGQAYAEWMDSFESRKAHLIKRDGGAPRVIRIGRRRMGLDARVAYPGVVEI